MIFITNIVLYITIFVYVSESWTLIAVLEHKKTILRDEMLPKVTEHLAQVMSLMKLSAERSKQPFEKMTHTSLWSRHRKEGGVDMFQCLLA